MPEPIVWNEASLLEAASFPCPLPLTCYKLLEIARQAIPIYDAIAQAVRSWDILRSVTYNDFAYETDILWLLQYLPATSHSNDVADLLKERFAQQQGSPQCDPDEVLRLKTLAEGI
jgi:hypothetical protein